MPFFGFTPSEGLLNDIQTGIANKNLVNRYIHFETKSLYNSMKKLLKMYLLS